VSAPARAELVAALRRDSPATHALHLDLGSCSLECRTSDPALRDELARYFSSFIVAPGPADILITVHEAAAPDWGLAYAEKAPDPGKTKVKEEFLDIEGGRVVRKRLTGMVFVFGRGENACVGPCAANANQVVNFINNRHIEFLLNRGCLLGHASGVARDGRGLSLAGFSGMGKSTLALHLMSRGLTFVSNDRMLVEREGRGLRMHGVAKQPRINPGTALNNPDLACIVAPEDRRRFGDMTPEELWKLEHKYDALVEECFGPGRFQLTAPMRGLVVLNWRRGEGPASARLVDPAGRRDLLAAFIKAPGVFYLSDGRPEPTEQDYVDLLSRAALIEISGGVDFDRAADVCVRFLEEGRVG
jgi:HprK-related kinase B